MNPRAAAQVKVLNASFSEDRSIPRMMKIGWNEYFSVERLLLQDGRQASALLHAAAPQLRVLTVATTGTRLPASIPVSACIPVPSACLA